MIREKTDPCASVKLPPFGRWGFAESHVFDKSTPNGICVAPCDLWANSPTCFFKRIGRLVVSHRSRRFPDADSHRLRKISVYLPHQLCDLWFDQSPRMASVLLRSVGVLQSSRMVIPHSASEGNTDFFAVLLVSLPQITQIFRCRFTPPAKNPCRSAAPTARSVLLTSSPHGICAYLRDPWENKNIQPVL